MLDVFFFFFWRCCFCCIQKTSFGKHTPKKRTRGVWTHIQAKLPRVHNLSKLLGFRDAFPPMPFIRINTFCKRSSSKRQAKITTCFLISIVSVNIPQLRSKNTKGIPRAHKNTVKCSSAGTCGEVSFEEIIIVFT